MAGDKLLRDFDGKKESSAGRRNVQAGGFRRPDLRLNEAGGGGKNHVRRGRRHENEIDLVTFDARLFHRGERGLGAHVAGVFVRRGDPAFLDAGTSGNPLVVGLDDFGKVIVR